MSELLTDFQLRNLTDAWKTNERRKLIIEMAMRVWESRVHTQGFSLPDCLQMARITVDALDNPAPDDGKK